MTIVAVRGSSFVLVLHLRMSVEYLDDIRHDDCGLISPPAGDLLIFWVFGSSGDETLTNNVRRWSAPYRSECLTTRLNFYQNLKS